MPNYKPIYDMSPREKQDWVDFLETRIDILSDKSDAFVYEDLFETEDGNVATAKDLCGVLLATLTEAPVTIP
jgi:hypothetical protein